MTLPLSRLPSEPYPAPPIWSISCSRPIQTPKASPMEPKSSVFKTPTPPGERGGSTKTPHSARWIRPSDDGLARPRSGALVGGIIIAREGPSVFPPMTRTLHFRLRLETTQAQRELTDIRNGVFLCMTSIVTTLARYCYKQEMQPLGPSHYGRVCLFPSHTLSGPGPFGPRPEHRRLSRNQHPEPRRALVNIVTLPLGVTQESENTGG